MNTSASQPAATLRAAWAAERTTLGCWLGIANTLTAEIAARHAFDYVCIDTQHGNIDYAAAATMIQAIELGGGTPIARVDWNLPGPIGKLLDAGAQAIIAPMVNTAEQAQAFVSAVKYPPIGLRSWGPTMARLRHPDYLAYATEAVAAIAMIETGEALANLDEILTTPGLDAIYVGPADLSASLGLVPRENDGERIFDEAVATIVAGCDRHGVVPGIHSLGANAKLRAEQGFRMITVASDVAAVRDGLGAALTAAGG